MVIPNSRPAWRMDVPPPHWCSGIPQGWLPVDIASGSTIVRWIQVGATELSEPFFHETVDLLRARTPAAFEFETDISVLDCLPDCGLPPAGVIFHMSRCGSTLLLNALKAAESVTGVGEAASVDHLLHLTDSGSRYWAAIGNRHLKSIVRVFAEYSGTARKVVLKCGSGGIVALRHIRKIWPNMRCVVLIRDPLEVLVSNVQRPPRLIHDWYEEPEKCWFGQPPHDMPPGAIDFTAWIVGRFCVEATVGLDDKCRVIDYRDLTPEAVADIAEWFGLTFSPAGLQDFKQAFRVHAKDRKIAYADDSEAKRRAATERIRHCSDRWIEPFYFELRERARMAAAGDPA